MIKHIWNYLLNTIRVISYNIRYSLYGTIVNPNLKPYSFLKIVIKFTRSSFRQYALVFLRRRRNNTHVKWKHVSNDDHKRYFRNKYNAACKSQYRRVPQIHVFCDYRLTKKSSLDSPLPDGWSGRKNNSHSMIIAGTGEFPIVYCGECSNTRLVL